MKNIKWLALAITGCLLLDGHVYGQAAQAAKAGKASGSASAVTSVDVSSLQAKATAALTEVMSEVKEAAEKAKKLAKEQLDKISAGVKDLEKNIKAMRYQDASELVIVGTPFLTFMIKLDGPNRGSSEEFTGIRFILSNSMMDELLNNIPDVTVAGVTIPLSQVTQSSMPLLAPVKNILNQIGSIISTILEVPLQEILKQTFKTQGSFQNVEGVKGTKMLTSTPAMDYFFRVALLTKDMNTKDKNGIPLIDKQTFNAELLIMTTKLIRTLGPDATFSTLLNQIPKPIEALLSPVKGQIQKLWSEISDIVNFDLNTIPKLKTLGNDDIKIIARIMGTICLDYYISYMTEQSNFVQTDAGKTAMATFKKDHNQKTFNAAFDAYKKAEFLKRVDALKFFVTAATKTPPPTDGAVTPTVISMSDDVKKASEELEQYKDPKVLEAAITAYINKDKQVAKDRFIALGKHISAYKKIKAQILQKLTFLNPLIAPITLEDLFPPDDEMSPQEKAAQKAEENAGTEALEAALADESISDESSGEDGEVSEDSSEESSDPEAESTGDETSDSETSDSEEPSSDDSSTSDDESTEQPSEE